MPRRKSGDFTREIGCDPVYGSELVQKLTNIVMRMGKKNAARKIVYDALEVLDQKAGAGQDNGGLKLFEQAFKQVIPIVEVRPRRVGGSVYQIPVKVRPVRARALALRWLVAAAAARPDKNMGLRLGRELLDAAEGRGGAIKKKMDMHKMAEANRAFSHYAW
jgi:small subunit ribosomal protein S7